MHVLHKYVHVILVKKAYANEFGRAVASCSGEQRAPCPSWSMQMEPEEMQKLLQTDGGEEIEG